MIAVPTRGPATTIATWALRRKKLPMPMRSGKRLRPAQATTTRTTRPTRPSRVKLGSGAIGSHARGPEGLQHLAVPHHEDALRGVAHGRVVRDEDEREVLLAVEVLHEIDDLPR